MELPRLHLAAWDGNIQLVRQFHTDGVNEKAGCDGEMIINLNLQIFEQIVYQRIKFLSLSRFVGKIWP